ncbi:MAG: tetratricopeptide repeat protein, partial [Chloroflexota bacterium]
LFSVMEQFPNARYTALLNKARILSKSISGDGVEHSVDQLQETKAAWIEVEVTGRNHCEAQVELSRIGIALRENATVAQRMFRHDEVCVFKADLWQLLASSLRGEQEWDLAAHAYDKLTTLVPDTLETRFWAGVLTILIDQEQAVSHLAAASSKEEYRRTAYELIGVANGIMPISNPEQAAKQLGIGYLSVGEPELALWQLSRAHRMNPADSTTLAYLGLAKIQLDQNGSEEIDSALSLDPDSALAHSVKGTFWLENQQCQYSINEFGQAIHLDPTLALWQIQLAQAYQMCGHPTKAVAALEHAAELAPDDHKVWVELANLYLEVEGDGDLALSAARNAVASAPESPRALDSLGWAQLKAGEIRQAEVNLRAAVNLAPYEPAILYHLGVMYRNKGVESAAKEAFQKAIAMDVSCRACSKPKLGAVGALATRALEQP